MFFLYRNSTAEFVQSVVQTLQDWVKQWQGKQKLNRGMLSPMPAQRKFLNVSALLSLRKQMMPTFLSTLLTNSHAGNYNHSLPWKDYLAQIKSQTRRARSFSVSGCCIPVQNDAPGAKLSLFPYLPTRDMDNIQLPWGSSLCLWEFPYIQYLIWNYFIKRWDISL